MRANLRTHPKVVRIASALKADRLRVVGGLHAVWCLFDEHSEDGRLYGYTPQAIDDLIGWPGFTDQLLSVEWVSWDGDDGLTLPEFDTHNGASAKRRAQEADRKRAERASHSDDCNPSAIDADKKRTREEKSREEKKETTPKAPKGAGDVLFDKFWAAYPKKEAKIAARKAFAKLKPDATLVDQMVQALEWQKRREQWIKEGGQFIPDPATWLNKGRWEDARPGDITVSRPNQPDPELEKIKAHKGSPIPPEIAARMAALKGKGH